MKKRFIIWLSALLITLLPALGSRAEEAAEPVSPVESDLWVIYVPMAQEKTDHQMTAFYAAQAIQKRWDDKAFHFWNPSSTTNNLAEGKPLEYEWFNRNGKSTGTGDFSQIEKDRINAENPHEFWVIVPATMSDGVVHNAYWTAFFGNMLAGNESTAVHYVFVGRDAKTAVLTGEDGLSNPVADLSAQYPDRVDWIILQDRFADSETDDPVVHTGTYFIASLYGKPVDLEIINNENGVMTFTVPAPGNSVLVLQIGVAELNVKWNGDTKPGEETWGIKGIKNADPQYNLWYLTGANTAGYTISPTVDTEVKAYWYPDLTNNLGASLILEPELEDGERWKRGDKTIRLQIEDELGRNGKGFKPGFIVQADENGDLSPTSDKIQEVRDEDLPDGRYWTYTLDISKVKNSMSITPTLELRMADGNLIWEMPEETRKIKVVEEELKVKDGIEEEDQAGTIYVYNGESNSLTKEWKSYFTFNDKDNPILQVEAPAESGLKAEKIDPNEFKISVTDINNPAYGPYQVQLTGMDKASDQERTTSIQVTVVDANKLLKGVTITTKQGDVTITSDQEEKNVNAGATIHVSVSCNNPDEWEKAKGSIAAFPSWDELTVSAKLVDKEPVHFMQNKDNGDWEADLTVPDDTADGDQMKLTVSVKNGDNEIQGIDGNEFTLTVVNKAPELKGELSETREISMGGIPDFVPFVGKYQEVEILKEAGLQNIWELFGDAETPDKLKVTVAISPVNDLRKEESGQEATEAVSEDANAGNTATPAEETEELAGDAGTPAEVTETPAENTEKTNDAGTWTYVLTREQQEVPDRIYALKPGQYKITLKASDGANESGPFTVELKVKSTGMQILSYVGIGLGALLLGLIAILVIRQARKPKFDRIRIRCLIWSDDSQERGREMMSKTRPISMANFGKKPVSLNTALMLARQPALTKEMTEVAEDITLLPTKHDELNILIGKKAMANLGQQEKKISLSQGNVHRIRMGNQYLMIENVQ